ncbi:hypothetical protein DE146DRAFT_636909 [Phaeosphaeria sp. MPI-PUGE-AT-0046c]|nr:hypothetical protein DE146DRAFT_636909 [Phaeosphaeria sp. MPI-PUGE-AT-0046c]
MRHGLHTPSSNAGSVKSLASSLDAAGAERIYLMSSNDDDAERLVLSRTETVKHSLIRDCLVNSCSFHFSTIPVDELVCVPLPSGGEKWERATRSVSLTWRRCKEFTTNVDTFYVVSAKSLVIDVVLSSDGWMEHQLPPGINDTQSSPKRYCRAGLVSMEDLDPGYPPHNPATAVHSCQQTSLSPNIQHAFDRVHALQNTQRNHEAERFSPSSQPGPVDHGQPTQRATSPPVQESPRGQLQVTGMWDKTPIKLLLDLDASGEAFYCAFEQWAIRRKRDGEIYRDRMTLYFGAHKNTPEIEAYDLSLKQSELEDLWELAVDWMLDNKNQKAPHLYATVIFEPE